MSKTKEMIQALCEHSKVVPFYESLSLEQCENCGLVLTAEWKRKQDQELLRLSKMQWEMELKKIENHEQVRRSNTSSL